MRKRMLLVLTVMAAFIAAIGVVKFLQIRTAMAQYASFKPAPEAVTTITAREEQWPNELHAIGTVAAVHGVTVSADLPGIVETIAFDSGRRVERGDVLVRLDTKEERAQLTAAEAQRDLARLDLDRYQRLLQKGVVAQAEYDRIAATAKEAEARVGEMRATIERKQIRAPFTGVLGIRQVNLGQYLDGGAPVVPLQSMDPVYVNFAVPQEQLGELRVGAEVRVVADSDTVAAPPGKVTAINSVVDEATRNVQIQAVFRNPRGTLHPGMFVEVDAVLGKPGSVLELPATAVSYAPYGNSVFVVSDLRGPDGKPYRGVQQRFVQLGGARGDQVAVVSGIKAGEVVVTSGVFKLRNGAAVYVNNRIRPENSPAPKPEDS